MHLARFPPEVLAIITSHLSGLDVITTLPLLGHRILWANLVNGGVTHLEGKRNQWPEAMLKPISLFHGLLSVRLTIPEGIGGSFISYLPSSLRSLHLTSHCIDWTCPVEAELEKTRFGFLFSANGMQLWNLGKRFPRLISLTMKCKNPRYNHFVGKRRWIAFTAQLPRTLQYLHVDHMENFDPRFWHLLPEGIKSWSVGQRYDSQVKQLPPHLAYDVTLTPYKDELLEVPPSSTAVTLTSERGTLIQERHLARLPRSVTRLSLQGLHDGVLDSKSFLLPPKLMKLTIWATTQLMRYSFLPRTLTSIDVVPASTVSQAYRAGTDWSGLPRGLRKLNVIITDAAESATLVEALPTCLSSLGLSFCNLDWNALPIFPKVLLELKITDHTLEKPHVSAKAYEPFFNNLPPQLRALSLCNVYGIRDVYVSRAPKTLETFICEPRITITGSLLHEGVQTVSFSTETYFRPYRAGNSNAISSLKCKSPTTCKSPTHAEGSQDHAACLTPFATAFPLFQKDPEENLSRRCPFPGLKAIISLDWLPTSITCLEIDVRKTSFFAVSPPPPQIGFVNQRVPTFYLPHLKHLAVWFYDTIPIYADSMPALETLRVKSGRLLTDERDFTFPPSFTSASFEPTSSSHLDTDLPQEVFVQSLKQLRLRIDHSTIHAYYHVRQLSNLESLSFYDSFFNDNWLDNLSPSTTLTQLELRVPHSYQPYVDISAYCAKFPNLSRLSLLSGSFELTEDDLIEYALHFKALEVDVFVPCSCGETLAAYAQSGEWNKKEELDVKEVLLKAYQARFPMLKVKKIAPVYFPSVWASVASLLPNHLVSLNLVGFVLPQDFGKLLPKTRLLKLKVDRLEHTSTQHLPRTLTEICALESASFSVDTCKQLPPNLNLLELNGLKKFTAKHAQALPQTLASLALQCSTLEEKALAHLPRGLTSLKIHGAQCLRGIRKLPPNLQHFTLTGSIDLAVEDIIPHLPPTGCTLNIDHMRREEVFVATLERTISDGTLAPQLQALMTSNEEICRKIVY